MRKLTLGILVIAVLFSSLQNFIVSADHGSTLTITADTTLTEDFTGHVIVGADNIVLDCNGHHIIGSGFFSAKPDFIGILLLGRIGVTVKNCHATGFFDGFGLISSSENTLLDNVATGNFQGFTLCPRSLAYPLATCGGGEPNMAPGSRANALSGNMANNNLAGGFDIGFSDDNTLTGNTADGNGLGGTFGSGFGLGFSVGNRLIGNTATNGFDGFSVEGVSQTLSANTALGNFRGFRIAATDSSFTDNTASSNTFGFTIARSLRDTFTGNAVSFNHFGFSLFSQADQPSAGNMITMNTILENSEGIHICASAIGTNTYMPNTFLIVFRLPPPGGVIRFTNGANIVVDPSC